MLVGVENALPILFPTMPEKFFFLPSFPLSLLPFPPPSPFFSFPLSLPHLSPPSFFSLGMNLEMSLGVLVTLMEKNNPRGSTRTKKTMKTKKNMRVNMKNMKKMMKTANQERELLRRRTPSLPEEERSGNPTILELEAQMTMNPMLMMPLLPRSSPSSKTTRYFIFHKTTSLLPSPPLPSPFPPFLTPLPPLFLGRRSRRMGTNDASF